MKVTGSQARFIGRWTVELQIEPGSVPDRRMPYSSVAAVYRPRRLRLEFTAGAKQENTAALRLENGSGFMKQAAEAVRCSSATIHGPRLKKDGTEGQHGVDEKFYGAGGAGLVRDASVPEWVREAVLAHLLALGGQPS